MQDNDNKEACFRSVLMILAGVMLIITACRHSTSVMDNSQVDSELTRASQSGEGVVYVNYRSFQNSDKTWGFTIFINSMPFRHYNRIPYRNSSTGFVSEEEAEKVAALFIKMINNGVHSPRLNKKMIDSLSITFKK